MKTAVIIDYKKIRKLKEMIKKSSYLDMAIDKLSYEISFMFFD